VSAAAVIVDSGGANLASLRFALQRLGAEAEVSADAAVIRRAAHVLLPGVGAAAPAMQRLVDAGLVPVLRSLAQPVLGICLGMQLLCAHSEEGPTACLGLLPERAVRLQPHAGVTVPHMGWNTLTDIVPDPLLQGVRSGERAYFVHSYAVPIGGACLARSEHGQALAAVIRCGNFYGTQFHPERSAETGARVLANFLRL
jgi:imidazole glycerol-phosphate synthase subunit HisH